MLNTTEEQLMTTQDAARVLGKSPATVRLYERTGKLPALRTVGMQRLFRQSEVLKLAESMKAKEVSGSD
jgi:excisionase family DNA binding protein